MKLSTLKVCIIVLISLLGMSSNAFSTTSQPTQNQVKEAKQKIQPINVNKASAKELASTLTGIGLKKAEAIVAFREKNGPFKSMEELTQIKGIGEKTLAKNKMLIKF